jgi:hypothetical protein
MVREPKYSLLWGFAGLIALTCTPQLFAQARVGSTGGGSMGMGSSGGSFGGGSSFGGGGGSSFSGGASSFSGGGSFGGGTSSFSGGTSFSGGLTSGSSTSFSGGITTGTGGVAGFQGGYGSQSTTARPGATSAGGVSSSNPFAAYYANPLAAGLAGSGTTTSRTTFGSALFANVNPTTTSSTSGLGFAGSRSGMGAMGGAGFMGGLGGGTASIASSATTTRRAPTYSASLSFSNNTAVPPRLQSSLQQIVTQSTALQASPGIQVAMEGSTVVLQGWAASDHDRRLAENMVRLTPGVRDVRNDVQIANLAPQPPAATPPAASGP